MAAIPEDAAALGAWLAEQREAAKLTQADLAQAAGVAARTIQRWEAGEHAPVDVIRVLTSLGVRLDPPEPEKVRGLNVAVSDVTGAIGELEVLLAQARAAEDTDLAGRLEGLSERVDAMAGATAESLARLEEAIVQLSEKRSPAGGRTHRIASE